MAVTVVLSEVQRAALAAVCDTFAPSIERDEDPGGFWARSAGDLEIPALIEERLSSGMVPEEQLQGLRQLLDALADEGIADAPQATREQIVHGFMASGPDALAGLASLRGLTHLLFYALPDPQTGRNPNWEAIGYPGPRSAPPSPEQAPKTISVTRPEGADLELTADVVVVGSGSGGGVVAGASGDLRQGRRRPRGRRLLQRGRLQPARAVGLREPLPRGRHRSDRGRSPGADDGLEPRRWLDGQLDQLPAPAIRGCARSGSASTASRASPGLTSTASSTRSAGA